MATFVQTPAAKNPLAPVAARNPLSPPENGEVAAKARFVKFGAFDENNYKPNELKKAQEAEKNFPPIRLMAGDHVYGTITSAWDTEWGGVMYVDAKVTRLIDGAPQAEEDVGKVKIPLSVDLQKKLTLFTPKTVNDFVSIEYLGKHPSPTNPGKTLHKFNVK